MTDWYRFTETYSKSWEFKEDERKDEGIETNDLLYTEELICTLKNLYIIEGNDEKIEIKDIFLALKAHFESCELKQKMTEKTKKFRWGLFSLMTKTYFDREQFKQDDNE